jgi:protein involved in polysaccharide export with SLBB domain
MRSAVTAASLAFLAGCAGRRAAELGPGPFFPETPAPASAPPPQAGAEEPDALEPPAEDRYRIRTGDVLEISILGEPEMTRSVPVGPDGRVSYYVAHDIMAAGKTFEELRNELRGRLTTHFKDPQVSVTGEAYKGNTVSVLGTVRKPGAYVVRSDTRLLDVLAMAGGVAQHTYWTPQGATIDIPDLRRAYLLRGSAFVVRGSLAHPTVIPVNMRGVAVGARPDVPLRCGDIVYVPKTVLGKASEIASQILPLLNDATISRDLAR